MHSRSVLDEQPLGVAGQRTSKVLSTAHHMAGRAPPAPAARVARPGGLPCSRRAPLGSRHRIPHAGARAAKQTASPGGCGEILDHIGGRTTSLGMLMHRRFSAPSHRVRHRDMTAAAYIMATLGGSMRDRQRRQKLPKRCGPRRIIRRLARRSYGAFAPSGERLRRHRGARWRHISADD
jgi:hypothetical protein